MERVLISGVTGGIGGAIARKMVENKIVVVGAGKNKERLQGVAENFDPSLFSAILCDLRDINATKQCIDKLKGETFDWVVFGAGHIDTERDFLRQDSSEIEQTFAINTLAVIHLSQALLPRVSKGFIIISSTAGLRGNKEYPVYSSSKAAVNTFVQALARAYPDRIFVAVCPGPTNTRMRQVTQGDAEKHQSPSVIADVAYSLIRNTNEFRSGDILSVRGGVTEIVSRID